MEALLLVFGIFGAYVIYSYFTSGRTKPTGKQNHLKPETQQIKPSIHDLNKEYFRWPELGEYEFEVVGESYYQAAISNLAKEQETKHTLTPTAKVEPLTAYLIPDDNNPYDNKAIRVDIGRMQVGHLSKDDARSFRRRLASKKLTGQVTTCNALITGGHIKNGEQLSYGIILDLKPFD